MHYSAFASFDCLCEQSETADVNQKVANKPITASYKIEDIVYFGKGTRPRLFVNKDKRNRNYRHLLKKYQDIIKSC